MNKFISIFTVLLLATLAGHAGGAAESLALG